MMLQGKNPSTAPVIAPGQDLRLERAILSNQLQELESTRRALTSELQRASEPAARQAITDQLSDVNRQIGVIDNMLARTQSQLSAAPGAAVTVVPSQPVFIQKGPPNAAYFLGSLLTLVLLLPFSMAMARRVWRRSPAANAPIPAALDARLARMEQTIEATAIEVERIGEGQRFVTRLLTESEPARRLESARERPL